MSSSREAKKDSLESLVSSARPFHEARAVQGTAQLVGTLRKGSDSNSLALILSGEGERVATLKMEDVVKHEVLQDTQEGDKVVRLYVRPDAEVNISEKSSAASIAGSAGSSALKVPIEKIPWQDPKMPWIDPKMPWFDKRPWWDVQTRPWFDDPKMPGFEGTGPEDTIQENTGTLVEQGGGTLAEQGGFDPGQVVVNPAQVAAGFNPQQMTRQDAPFVMATPHMAPQWKAIESQAFGPAAGIRTLIAADIPIRTNPWRDVIGTVTVFDNPKFPGADTGVADTWVENIDTFAEQGGMTIAEGTTIDPGQIVTIPEIWSQMLRSGLRG
jgi:hypothetical protein